MTPRSAGVVAALVALTVGTVTACGDDDPASQSTTSPVPTATPTTPEITGTTVAYPPNDIDDLRTVFDPLVAPLGLHLTRGALVDRSNGYEASDTGTHLALYVEPLDDATYTTDDYVDGIYDLTAVVTPAVFDRFSAVQSYDICQEPPQSTDDSDAPFPLTQLEMSRDNYLAYDWANGSLSSMILFLRETDGASLAVGGDVADAPSYYQALRDAGYQVPSLPD